MRTIIRNLFAVATLFGVVATGACSSDDSVSMPTTSALAPGMLPDAERRSAYEHFLSAGRQWAIDEKIEACGGTLLAKLNSGEIPVEKSGGRKTEPAPQNGLGLLYSSHDYVAPPGQASVITLTVYFINGEVDKVHGIEIGRGDSTYTLRGWRVARPDGNHTDHGIDAYSWKIQHGNGKISAMALGWPDAPTESTYGKPISLSQNFAPLGIGFNQLNLSDEPGAMQINTDLLQRADKLFLGSIPCQ